MTVIIAPKLREPLSLQPHCVILLEPFKASEYVGEKPWSCSFVPLWGRFSVTYYQNDCRRQKCNRNG